MGWGYIWRALFAVPAAASVLRSFFTPSLSPCPRASSSTQTTSASPPASTAPSPSSTPPAPSPPPPSWPTARPSTTPSASPARTPRSASAATSSSPTAFPSRPPKPSPRSSAPTATSFRPSLADFFAAVLRGKVSAADIAREALAQIHRIQQQASPLTHIDTHKHTHILPRVARPLLAVAERTGIPAIRNPFEPRWSIALGKSRILRRAPTAQPRASCSRASSPCRRSAAAASAPPTAPSASPPPATSTPPPSAHSSPPCPSGTWELVCHPGYNDRDLDAITTRLRATRDIERAALLDAFSRNLASSNTRNSSTTATHQLQQTHAPHR